MTAHPLLSTFIAAYPAQPATGFWRAIEIGALVRHGLPEGLGLDLGCGDGKLTDIVLQEAGQRRLVGIDPDPLETEAAKRFAFYERVHTCRGDAIPEPDATFDFVISNSVLEHIPGLEATIAETARVLKPGGVFLFTVPGPAFHDNLHGALFGGQRTAYLAALDRRLAHVNYLSQADWSTMLGRNGLALDACLGYLDRAETQRWETLSRATGGLLYSVFGERQRPIEIQRKIGARQLQNAGRLPDVVARTIASLISVGLSGPRSDAIWVEAERASCLLVAGRRP